MIMFMFQLKILPEVALGRSIKDLERSRVMDIKGRENIKNVVIDRSSTFKKFTIDNFPNATITVDKFHIIKLFNHALNSIRFLGIIHFVDKVDEIFFVIYKKNFISLHIKIKFFYGMPIDLNNFFNGIVTKI